MVAARAPVAAAQLPPPLYSVGGAFDSARNRLVIFGGYDGSYHGDTWEWDGASVGAHLLDRAHGKECPPTRV